MTKRKICYKSVFLALVLTILIFVSGIIIGNNNVEKKYENLEGFISDLRLQTMSLELQYELMSDEPCKAIENAYLTEELAQLNSRLDYLENLYGTNSPEILQMKQYYSLLQIQHWMLFREARESCDVVSDLILYFYSNEDCQDCATQGSVLTAFRKKYKEEVKVYAFDMNLEDPAINTLEQMFKVGEVPSIVYNEELFSGFVPFSMLEDLLTNKKQNIEVEANITQNISNVKSLKNNISKIDSTN